MTVGKVYDAAGSVGAWTIVLSTAGLSTLLALWLIPLLGFIGTCITEPIIWTLCAAFLAILCAVRRKILFGEA